MKRILFVIDSLTCGGAEKSLVTLLSSFDYSRYNVDLMMFQRGGSFEKFLSDKVNIIEPPSYMKFLQGYSNNRTCSMLKTLLRVKTSIKLRLNKINIFSKKHTAQVIWENIYPQIETLNKEYNVAIAYSQGLPTYYVATKVNAQKKFAWINVDYKQAGYDKSFDGFYYKNFSNIVVVSERLRNILMEYLFDFKDKIITIYDIISPDFLYNLANQESGFKDNFKGLRLFTIGRLVPLKGYDMAVEACEMLIKEGYEVKWYVSGEGSWRSYIENLIQKKNLQDKFILMGEQINPYKYLKDIDIYVQTSRFEGFGLTIAEAKIFKKVIVSTNFAVVNDQLINEKNGIVVDIDALAIYKGIKKVIDDKALRGSIVDNLDAANSYDTTKEIEKVYELIES